MKSFLPSALFVVVMLFCTPTSATHDKPVKANSPLSADEVSIYSAILRQYSEGKDIALNVSQTTYPLDPSSPLSGLQGAECLKGIHLENIAVLSRSFHDLPPDVLPGKKMKLVDPRKQATIVGSNDPSNTIPKGKPVEDAVQNAFSTALFSMSEIAFDKDRRFAVVSYRFWCGSLCGNGSTLVFEKVKGEWRDAHRNCGGWIS
jgi:hypothetical protein